MDRPPPGLHGAAGGGAVGASPAAAAGDLPPAHTGDGEIGGHVFDFLFAAQDASTSSLCDFRRHATEGCDGLAYIPTIAPRDDCAVHLKPRGAELPLF